MQKPLVWDLTPLFDNDTDSRLVSSRKKVETQTKAFIKKWHDRTDYLSESKALKEALDEYEAWLREYGAYDAEIYYFSLRTSQDQLDPGLKASYNQAIDRAKKLENEIQFFTLRLAKIPVEYQTKFQEAPELSEYHHFLERLFVEAKHHLSEAEEKIMNLKSQSSRANWIKLTDTLLAKEEKDGKNLPRLLSLLQHPDRKTRLKAGKSVGAICAKIAPIAEHEINSILTDKKVNDELRHFPRPDGSRHLADDIDSQIVDVLVESVSSKFPLAHRWYHLKAKLLGQKRLEYSDRVASYGHATKKYSYDEATSLISAVFTRLSPDFGEIFDRLVADGHLDVYPKKGKQDGAFCSAGSLTLPTYVLLNHTNLLTDVTTMAHEAGHAINDELMKQSQNALNFGSPLSTAEVASTFFEDFVLEEILRDADDETRLGLMVKKLDDDIATIFRQVACYRFELGLHQAFRTKGYLSQAEIGAIFKEHMVSYLGPAVRFSSGSENWWVYWGHIRNFFYVYSYASGLLISKSLQHSVKADPAFITKVKEFLSAGSSDSPKNIFLRLGIDVTKVDFWKNGLAETEKLLSETESLARRLGRIT